MSTTIAFALLGLAVLAFLAVIGVILIASLVKAFRRPPPAANKATLNPEDRNLDFFRRMYPDPAVTKAQAPRLEELHVDFRRRRKEEEELADVRRNLDTQHRIGTPSPSAAPTPSPNV